MLLTGHTGFKGSWLAFWLVSLGARVAGVSLPPHTQPSLFELLGFEAQVRNWFADVRDAAALADIVAQVDPEIVFHLAAQPLVRASYLDPLGTFSTNVQGTANLLDALRGRAACRVFVGITTDKVYRNLEHAYPFRETDELGGHDPYSASKAASEHVIGCYRDAFLADEGVAVASARAGNVIGGGDWSEDRLIPDAVRAWSSGAPLIVRRPDAIRPWQHVLEPLNGYLMLAERLWQRPELAMAYNFGPATDEAESVREVISLARETFTDGAVEWGDGTEGPHEAGWLALEVARARHQLGVAPRWSLRESVERTMSWYARHRAGESATRICDEQISEFRAPQDVDLPVPGASV